jgi:histidinol-phosphatase
VRIEARLRELIAANRPDDAVLGEEAGRSGEADARRTWILDPIDGTKNFAARIQIWATLIALAVDGEPVLGVASAPALGERYEATSGTRARLNGRAIRVSQVSSVDESLISSTGMHSLLGTPWADAFVALAGDAYRSRGFGDFWGHMLVARGSAEAMIEPQLRTWDWAAVKVIVEEAGGRMTQLDGSPVKDRMSVLSTNGLLHDEIITRFRARPS